jgi:hypothetical protein
VCSIASSINVLISICTLSGLIRSSSEENADELVW